MKSHVQLSQQMMSLFDCFDEAFDHINEIYNDPLLWWNSAKIQKIREEFAFCCSFPQFL